MSLATNTDYIVINNYMMIFSYTYMYGPIANTINGFFLYSHYDVVARNYITDYGNGSNLLLSSGMQNHYQQFLLTKSNASYQIVNVISHKKVNFYFFCTHSH